MSKDDPLLDQADALMRRHRVYLASAQDDTAEVEPAPGSDRGSDDVPVLTEEVSPEPPVAETEEPSQARHNLLLAGRRTELAQAMETWLDEQLPQLVILAMDGITDHLISVISNRAREELLTRLDAVLMPATSSGSSALSTETPGRVQAPKVDSGALQHPEEAGKENAD